MKKYIFCLFFCVLNICVFGKEYNIHNLFQINIPDEIEVVKIDQKLRINNYDSQYWLANWFYIIYDSKYFVFLVDCFGSNNKKLLDGSEKLNMTTNTYISKYNIADQLKFLKQNYSECIISIYNIWYSFAKNQQLEMDNNPDYKEKYMLKGGSLKNIFQLLEILEESLSFTISNNTIKIINGYNYKKYNSDDSFICPTIKNLRMRREPSLNSEVLGYMSDTLYEIIIIGNEINIDGIKGNWILIKPENKNNLSWVFSGYTRKATEEEIFNHFPH